MSDNPLHLRQIGRMIQRIVPPLACAIALMLASTAGAQEMFKTQEDAASRSSRHREVRRQERRVSRCSDPKGRT